MFAKLIESTLWQSPLVIVQQFVKLFHLENSFTSLFREKDFSSSCFAGRSNSTSSTSWKLDLDWLGMFWKWQSHPIQSITLLLQLPNFFISLSTLVQYHTHGFAAKKSCLTKLFMGEETSHESYTRMSAGEGKKISIYLPSNFLFFSLSVECSVQLTIRAPAVKAAAEKGLRIKRINSWRRGKFNSFG